jgi:protein SCO1/2
MAPLKILRFLLPALLLGLAGASMATKTTPFKGTEVGRGGGYAQDFRLADHDGKPRTLADFRGKAVVLFFGYLQCPNYCPLTLAKLAEVMALLGPDAQRVQVLFITVDPERDTPQALKEYVSNFHPSFLGLHATPQATPALALGFRVYYRKVPGNPPGNYHIDHAVFSYAYDPAGRLRLRLSDSLTAADIAADLRRLLHER